MSSFKHRSDALSVDTIESENFYYFREPVPLGTRLRSLFGLFLLWHRRWKQRGALAGLDAHLLRDIGVTPRQALREVDKPFWQA